MLRSKTHFGAVRVTSERGTQMAQAQREVPGSDVGPIPAQNLRLEQTLFLVSPRVALYRWPPGVRELGPAKTVCVLAFHHDDAVVSWISYPSATTPFVSRQRLRGLLMKATGWSPVGEA